ncbi:MAG: GNAT family N-acetyltransferase [Chloroflexota bacterium]
MKITIREAQPQDVDSVVRLIRELAEMAGEASPITEAYAAEYLSSPISRVFLAESEGQVIGLLSYSVRPDLYHAGSSCLIEELVVQQSERDQGVGSALLSALLSRLEGTDCAEVSVAAMPENAGAVQFYRQHGLAEEALFLEKHFIRV